MSEHEKPLHVYWEKFAIWLTSIIVAIAGWAWLEHQNRLNELDSKIASMQADKVSRIELTALEDRMYKRMDTMKTDIIDRLDWYFAGRKSKD